MSIDTSAYDKFRQGVNVTNFFQRRGVLPVLGPALASSVVEVTVFGQPKTFSDNTPFDDLAKYEAKVYLIDSGSMYPTIMGNVDLSDPDQLDGVIEPFDIRKVVSFTTTEFPFQAHSIKGDLIAGNSDTFRKNQLISGEFIYLPVLESDPFIDASDAMGDTTLGAIRLQGLSPDDERLLSSFDDAQSRSRIFNQTPAGNDMISALVAMTGSNIDNYMGNDFRSAGKGFTYESNSPIGTDSIAFGGLRRS